MQQLETSKQIVEAEQKYKRECKGRSLARTKKVYRLVNTDVFYVESESSNDTYYFVKFKPGVIEFCSCTDSSTRNVRCKHSWACEYAIRLGTLIDIDKLPAHAKRNNNTNVAKIGAVRSYKDDGYSF
jgi:hypothetical protein